MRTLDMKDIPLPELGLPDLAGHSAIVTGGERGIGQGIAATLGRLGMKLIVIGISGEEGAAMQNRFQDEHLTVTWIEADLTQPDVAADAVAAAFAVSESIPLLVNNAVQNQLTDFLEYDDALWDKTVTGNLRMIYRVSLEWAKRQQKAGGSIINVSSVGGLRAHRRSVGYDTAKGAIDSMTRALALELAPSGIRVNAVAPGAIINRPIPPGEQDYRQERADGIPLGRLGTVTDVAHLVAFLASQSAAYITGQTLYVDGGLTAQLTPPGIYI